VQPTRLRLRVGERLTLAVESVGKVAFHEFALNKINHLRVEKQPKSGFSYRLVSYRRNDRNSKG